MGQFIDLVGQVFGRLTVVSREEIPGSNRFRWLCLCTCGKHTSVVGSALRGGITRSCGCSPLGVKAATMGDTMRRANTTHGASKTVEYSAWAQMLDRCHNPRYKKYADYGGRGIKVCARWRASFENFLEDMGPRPVGKTLDRKDNDKGYSPGNCRRATREEQQNNTRTNRRLTWEGLTLTVAEWARRQGINVETLRARLKQGWPVPRALGDLT